MHSRAAPHRLLLIALAICTLTRSTHAQSAECINGDCPPSAAPASVQEVWLQASRVHQLKVPFVDALRAFTQAQAGAVGDEGPALRESLSAMRDALDRWDQAIADFEAALIGSGRSADIHVALATVYLNRHRPDAALRELEAAARFDASRADVFTLQALAYGLTGDANGATEALRRAAALEPSNPAVWYSLARSALAAGRAEDRASALKGLHAALRPPGKRVVAGSEPPFQRVGLLREIAGIAPIFPVPRYAMGYAALREGDYRSAIEHFARAVEEDPLVHDSPSRKAVSAGASLLRAGDIRGALHRLQEAATRFPADAGVHRVLGLACLADGAFDRSIERLRTAVQTDPHDVRARMLLADAFITADRSREAEQELSAILGLFPDSDGARYRLGLLYERDTRLPEAVEALTGGDGLHPVVGRDQLLHILGSIYVKQSNLDAAIAAYGRRVDINPNNAEAHRVLGDIYFLQGDDEAALAEFEVAAFIERDNAKALVGSGHVHLRAKRYEESVRALEEAMTADPDALGPEGHYARGMALLRLGYTEEAMQALERSSELQAREMAAGQRAFEMDALARQAEEAAGEGQVDRAVALLDKAAAMQPDAGRVRRQLGATLLEAGRFRDAITALTRALALEPTAEGHRLLAEAHAGVKEFAERDRQIALAAQVEHEDKLRRLHQLTGTPR